VGAGLRQRGGVGSEPTPRGPILARGGISQPAEGRSRVGASSSAASHRGSIAARVPTAGSSGEGGTPSNSARDPAGLATWVGPRRRRGLQRRLPTDPLGGGIVIHLAGAGACMLSHKPSSPRAKNIGEDVGSCLPPRRPDGRLPRGNWITNPPPAGSISSRAPPKRGGVFPGLGQAAAPIALTPCEIAGDTAPGQDEAILEQGNPGRRAGDRRPAARVSTLIQDRGNLDSPGARQGHLGGGRRHTGLALPAGGVRRPSRRGSGAEATGAP